MFTDLLSACSGRDDVTRATEIPSRVKRDEEAALKITVECEIDGPG
jgi:hypothetical protein